MQPPDNTFALSPLCNTCYRPTENGCSRCGATYYCSVDCQKSDWKIHKFTCFGDESSSHVYIRMRLCQEAIAQVSVILAFHMNMRLNNSLPYLMLNEEGTLKTLCSHLPGLLKTICPQVSKSFAAQLLMQTVKADAHSQRRAATDQIRYPLVVACLLGGAPQVFMFGSKQADAFAYSVQHLPNRLIFDILYDRTQQDKDASQKEEDPSD